jgi:hypothetical protein
MIDQAVLNRARLAVEKPRRAWTFNLTWVHGLATMGVAALALTMFLQLRDMQPEAPSPAAFEVQLQKSADERKDEDAAAERVGELRRVARDAAPAPVATPPVPEYEFSEPLADAPGEASTEGRESDAVATPEPDPRDYSRAPAQASRAANQAAAKQSVDMLEEQSTVASEAYHQEIAAEGAAGLAMQAEPGADNEAAVESIYIGEGESLFDDVLDTPLYPLAKTIGPKDPDARNFRVCRVPGDPKDPVARQKARCEAFSSAGMQFDQMRRYRAQGETARFQRLRERFVEQYPDYPIPADLTE